MANYDNMHDDKKIDLVMKYLYENLPAQLNIYGSVFKPLGIVLTPREISRIAAILESTGFVQLVGGYGDDVMVGLTPNGLQIMRKHGGYISFLVREQITNYNERITNEVKMYPTAKKSKIEVIALWATIIGALAAIIVIFL